MAREPADGYVKVHREFWTCEDLAGASASTRLIFLGLVSFARATGKYRGLLLDSEYHVLRLRRLAPLLGVSRHTLRRALEYLAEPEREMIRWETVKGRPCIEIANYAKWQGGKGAELPHSGSRHRGAELPHQAPPKGAELPHQKGQNCPMPGQNCPTGADEEGRRRKAKEDPPTPEEGAQPQISFEDEDGPATTGLPAVVREHIRMRLGDLLTTRFRPSDDWNGGVALRWHKDLALAVHGKDTTIDELERWLTAEETQPRMSDMRLPVKWLDRCYSKRDFQQRRRGKARAKPPKHEGGELRL